MATFSREEYAARVARARQAMSEKGIDVLVVTDANNLNYLCGYSQVVFYHTTFLVLALDEEEPIWVGREYTCAPLAKLTTYLDESRIIGFSEDFATHFLRDGEKQEAHDPMGVLAGLFESKRWANKRIGVEWGGRILTVSQGDSLRRQLPNATFVDATAFIETLRFIKSDEEIVRLRIAGQIADLAMAAAMDGIASGLKQCEVYGRIHEACLKGTPEFGGEPPEMVGLTSGRYVPTMHGPIFDAPFEKDQLANIEICGCRLGYNTTLVRSAVVGKAADDVNRLESAVIEAIDASLDVARAGATCADIARAYLGPITAAGFRARPMIGYSAGLGLIGQGTQDSDAMIALEDDTRLEENMVFHIVPCFELESVGGWAMFMSETIRITQNGAPELLCNAPRQLHRC